MSADVIPVTQREGHEFARAIVELTDRCATLEDHCRRLLVSLEAAGVKVAAQFDYGALKATPGQGEQAVRARVAAIEAGRWGGASIEEALAKAKADARRQPQIPVGRSPQEEAFERQFRVEAAKLGGRVLADGLVEFSRDHSDPQGNNRRAQAAAAARAALAETAATTNGGRR